MYRKSRTAAGATALLVSLSFGAALAGEGAPARTVAYIDREDGTGHENTDVDEGSSCRTPDQQDTQIVSDPLESNNSVLVGGCLFGDGGARLDRAVTFTSKGVGKIIGCPDPDGGGPRVSFTHDHDQDDAKEHCHVTGFDPKDRTYFTRVNNTGEVEREVVVFCFDPHQRPAPFDRQPRKHGCSDAHGNRRSRVVIFWTR